MASRHCASSLRGTGLVIRCRTIPEVSIDTSRRICIPTRRSMATAVAPNTPIPSQSAPPSPPSSHRTKSGLVIPSALPSHIQPHPQVLTTVYSFPTLEPLYHDFYPSTHLSLPLRRDLLHRAIVFEGDNTRQGTSSTKYRSEVHGSGKKIRPQKGTGHARLGDRKSPMLRGGVVAHGPRRERSFKSELQRKVYDRAWRMALSYRWRRGELVVVEGLDVPSEISEGGDSAYWLKWALDGLGWGNGKNSSGHSFFITKDEGGRFKSALDECERYGRLRSSDEVDVKNLLEMKRLVVEKGALLRMLRRHQSDLKMPLVRTPEQVARQAELAAVRKLAHAEALSQVTVDGFVPSESLAESEADELLTEEAELDLNEFTKQPGDNALGEEGTAKLQAQFTR